VYAEYSKNSAGLIVLDLYMNGTDAEIIEYDEKEGVIFPSVSGDAGTGDVIMKYVNGGGMLFPTVAVIAPDKDIVENYDGYNSYYEDISGDLDKYNINQTAVSDAIPDGYGSSQPGIIINSITAGKIELFIPHGGRYTLTVYTADGKKLQVLCDKTFKRGNHTVACNLEQFAGNVLFLNGRSGHNAVVKKFIMYK